MKIETEIKLLRGAVMASLALSAVILTTGMKANNDARFGILNSDSGV